MTQYTGLTRRELDYAFKEFEQEVSREQEMLERLYGDSRTLKPTHEEQAAITQRAFSPTEFYQKIKSVLQSKIF